MTDSIESLKMDGDDCRITLESVESFDVFLNEVNKVQRLWIGQSPSVCYEYDESSKSYYSTLR